MKANRFAGFADEDQVATEVKQQQQQVKQQEQAKKKVVVKVQKDQTPLEDAHEFEKVDNNRAGTAQRGDRRGGRGQGRGGRGEGRGGRGGQDRPQRDGDDNRRGGDRRRGRGDRPQTAKPVVIEGLEGAPTEEKKEQREVRRGRGGRDRRADGKPREDAHPMDRQDGTGRGRRGDRKAGHGKGNWGKEGEEKKADQEESKEEKPRREEKPKEPEPEVVEEEEEGFTLDDFMAAKQAKSQGLYQKKDARALEKGEMKNIQNLDSKKMDEISTTKIYNKKDVIATKPNQGKELLGFQGQADAGDEFEARGGKRGGRGGNQGPRPDRQNDGQRRRKGGKVVTDDDFPTL